MKIPRKIRMDGVDWKIIKTSNDLNSNIMGTTYPHAKEILLSTDSGQIESTFLHEVVHVIDLDRGLELSENQVQSLASGLYAAIVDNNLDFRRGK